MVDCLIETKLVFDERTFFRASHDSYGAGPRPARELPDEGAEQAERVY